MGISRTWCQSGEIDLECEISYLRNNLGFGQACCVITAEGFFDKQLRRLCRKPEAVILHTNLAKSPDYSHYNILGQLSKHLLSPFFTYAANVLNVYYKNVYNCKCNTE